MTKTDRQTDKTTRWEITVYEPQYDMLDTVIKNIKDDPNIRMIKYQDEICPDTGRKHRQGCMLTAGQHRFKGKVPNESCRKLLPNVHIEPARDWPALLKYCEKEATRDPNGHAVKAVSEYVRTETHDLMTDIAKIYLELKSLMEENAQLELQILPVKKEGEKVTDFLTREYVALTSEILRRKPQTCGFYGQPLPRNLWKDYRDVWIDRAISITPVPSDSEAGINEIIIETSDITNAPETHQPTQGTQSDEEEGCAEGESDPEHES